MSYLNEMKKLPIAESYWVEENRFLAGEYPVSRDPETARHRLDAFLEAGVNTFIDLTESHELFPYEGILKEEAKVYGIDVSHQRLPIRDLSVPSSSTMTTILDAIDSEIKNGRCIYVHCWGGIGRTGMVVACYLIRHGKSNEQALEHLNRLYKTRPVDIYHPRSPETDAQVEFVRNWWEDRNTLNWNLKTFCEG
jgi:protein-tyrosine phosphatase